LKSYSGRNANLRHRNRVVIL